MRLHTVCVKNLGIAWERGYEHHHRQSFSMTALSAQPFESVVGTLRDSNWALLEVLLCRGVPVGVVYGRK